MWICGQTSKEETEGLMAGKYTTTFKEAMVKKLTIPGASSVTALAREVGIHQTTLSRWVREYAMGVGEGEGMKGKRPQEWSAAEKLEVVIEAGKLDEENLGRYLREKGLHTVHLQQWKQEILEAMEGKRRNGKSDPRDKRIRELERELRRKESALAEAAALLVLKKKAHDIWGDREGER